jgi:hypothetical protein
VEALVELEDARVIWSGRRRSGGKRLVDLAERGRECGPRGWRA